MLSNETIQSIIDECDKSGYTIKMRDIAFVVLCYHYESEKLAFKCIFNNDELFDDYNESNSIKFLKAYIRENKLLSLHSSEQEISFQENKKEIEKLLNKAQEMYENEEIDANQYLQRCTDIRVKLNDKFDVKQEERKEQMVIVEAKYTSICPHCHREIQIPTDEDLIKKYGLISPKNI